MWIYGSGFPKSMNLGVAIDKKNGVESEDTGIKINVMKSLGIMHDDNWKSKESTIKKAKNEWQGWGTCLKPAFEPVIVARKPFDGSLVDNVLKYGVGGLNIDECRVPMSSEDYCMIDAKSSKNPTSNYQKNEAKKYGDYALDVAVPPNENGRFPANLILTYGESDYDEVCGGFPISGSGNGGAPYNYAGREYNNKDTSMFNGDRPQSNSNYNDTGSASRYFYCAKASKKDRDSGLDKFDVVETHVLQGRKKDSNGSLMKDSGNHYGRNNPANPYAGAGMPKKNIHPSVKPVDLMQYLVRLVAPKGATILDPFMGSGSTGKAVMFENRERNADYKFIGVELSEEYLPIAEARIKFAECFELDTKEIEKPQKHPRKSVEKSQKSDEKMFEKWGFGV